MKAKPRTTIPAILTAAADALGGAEKFAGVIGLSAATVEAIRAGVEIVMKGRDDCDNAKIELAERRHIVRTLVGSTRNFLMTARDTYKGRLGKKPGLPWLEVGFPVDSLAVPFIPEQIQPRLQKIDKFMKDNPTFETPILNITAAEAEMWYSKLSDARVAVNEQESIVATLITARNEAKKKLNGRLSVLSHELRQLLSLVDPRWKAFGFNPPGAPSTPEVPTNVIATLIGTNAISVKWTAAERAERYRVSARVVGVDTEFVSKGTPADLDFTIEGLPAHSQVEIVVSAINLGGESANSDVVKVTTL